MARLLDLTRRASHMTDCGGRVRWLALGESHESLAMVFSDPAQPSAVIGTSGREVVLATYVWASNPR
jgi:hypothetical protein